MGTAHRIFLLLLFAMAALFRSWGAYDFQEPVGDEVGFIALSKNLIANGVGDWKYAPMTDLTLAGAMRLFGDTPLGWRVSSVVFGTAAVLLIYLIARRLYDREHIPLIAASLLAFDPFHIHFSRTITQEMPTIFFFLLFLYLVLEHCDHGRRTLTWAGCALGCTIATKIYFVFAIPVVIVYALYRRLQRHEQRPALVGAEFVVKLLLLPLSLYLLAHTFWLGRGHTLTELLLLKSDSYWVFSHNFTFQNAGLLLQGGKPWEWFLKPFSFGHQLSQDGEYGRFALQINNPLFRMMVIPALAVVVYHAARTRRLQSALAPILFCSCYALFFLATRPINSYSALVLLPFAYLMLAEAVIIVASRWQRETETAAIFICAVIISGCYLFPVATGFPVPMEWYRPVLSRSDITGVF